MKWYMRITWISFFTKWMRNTDCLDLPSLSNHDIHLCARTARLFSTKETRGFLREWKVNGVNQARWFNGLLFRGWIRTIKKRIFQASPRKGRFLRIKTLQMCPLSHNKAILEYQRYQRHVIKNLYKKSLKNIFQYFSTNCADYFLPQNRVYCINHEI